MCHYDICNALCFVIIIILILSYVICFLYNYNFYSFKKNKKKKQVHLPESSLVPQVEILNFYEGVSSFQDFAIVVCDSITKLVDEGFDETRIHQLCWEHYSEVL